MKTRLSNVVAPAKGPLSAVLVLLLLFLNILAASPVLHLDFHDDAASQDHTCAVQAFSHGQCDSAHPDVTLVVPRFSPSGVQRDSSLSLPGQFFSVVSSRGPPLS